MVDALLWLLSIEVLGLLALPFAFVLFQRLPDRGFTVAKPMALALSSYILWVVGLSHLAPNSRLTIIVILLFGALISGLVLRSQLDRFLVFLKNEWRTLLVAQGVFLVFFLLWAGIVSEVPAINHTEKLMDFAFMNAVLQSRYFPPEDPWLAGHPISYYYFGHFTVAFLTRLTGIASSVSYNLSIPLIAAMAATGAFGLVQNLVRLSGGSRRAAIGFGLAAPALLLLVGNLEGALEFVHAQGWGSGGFWDWAGIKGLQGGVASAGAFPDQNWWWWRATRVIDTLSNGQSLDYTITEFPFFSFLLGDLHAHVVSLPFLILGLFVGLNLFLTPDPPGLAWLRHHPVEAIAIALFLGLLAFVNAWDAPLLAAVLGVLVLARAYGAERGDLQRAARQAALMLTPIFLAAVALFLPYYLTLDGQTSGILPLTKVSTRPFLFFLVMGLFSVLAISFLLRQLAGLMRPTRHEAPAALLVLIVTLAPFLLWLVTAFLLTSLIDGAAAAIAMAGGRALWVLPGLAVVALAGFSAAKRVLLGREPVLAFPLLLLAAAFYLLVGVELFYVVDLFGNRMNTVFKVYYQVWLLLSLVGAYGLYYWYSRSAGVAPGTSRGRPTGGLEISQWAIWVGRHSWTVAVVVLLLASLYYPVGAALDRTGVLRQGHSFSDNTFDGLSFIKDSGRGEYAAIQWLRDQAPWGRIVEAVGDDYSDYGRISASTGLPTVLGWKGHELQWRGGTRLFNGRDEDIGTIYRSEDSEAVGRLLKRYGVRYVYAGRRELSSYGVGHLASFDKLLKTVFQQSGVVIYEVLPGAGPDVPGGDDSGPS